jgi:DNA helicase IV
MLNFSFGLKTKDVEKISCETLVWKVLLSLILGNRTAIICNDYDQIPTEIKEFCTFNDLSADDKANVLTVKQAKGLEYDVVFVFDNQMNKNERYIAYTRALSELYIIK